MRSRKKLGKWGVHVCSPWSDCYGVYRINIRTPFGFWTIALTPGSRSQVYDRKTKQYTDRWAYITRLDTGLHGGPGNRRHLRESSDGALDTDAGQHSVHDTRVS